MTDDLRQRADEALGRLGQLVGSEHMNRLEAYVSAAIAAAKAEDSIQVEHVPVVQLILLNEDGSVLESPEPKRSVVDPEAVATLDAYREGRDAIPPNRQAALPNLRRRRTVPRGGWLNGTESRGGRLNGMVAVPGMSQPGAKATAANHAARTRARSTVQAVRRQQANTDIR